MSVDAGIRAFWTWWATARHRVLRAIEVDRKFSDDLVRDISDHVDAIGDLDWELSVGKTAKHAFSLSPKGNPEARLVTEVWRHRGPDPDQTWEYVAARQGERGRGSPLTIDKVTLDRNELMISFRVHAGREQIDARYFHPGFSKLSERLQPTALYLLLDGALGEDGVERWLGRIEASAEKPTDAVSFGQFMDAVAALETTATGKQFVIMQDQTETGDPVLVTCNQALKHIDHLLHTMHVAVDLAILDQNQQGLTTPADAEQLNQLEDELAIALGRSAVYFGRETKRGHRVMHWYATEDGVAHGVIERWSKQHDDRQPQVEWMRDPTWKFMKRYVR